jgi:hypothetical protein
VKKRAGWKIITGYVNICSSKAKLMLHVSVIIYVTISDYSLHGIASHHK